jgi:protein ImuB
MSYLAIWVPQLPWQALRWEQTGSAARPVERAQLVLEAHGIARQVVAASPAALQDGVAPGESEAQARLRAPSAEALERSPAAERRLQAWMQTALERFSDRCHALPPDRWLLNLDGMGLLGSPAAIARQAEAALAAAGLQPRLGLGATRTAALLRAARARGRSAGLADLPLHTLRFLPGVSGHAEVFDALERWGLRTLGEVAALPPRALRERLGRAGLDCQGWARGEDRGLLPHVAAPAAPEECSATFEPALDGYLPLLPWLERAVARHCAALEAHDGGVGALAVRLALEDERAWEWQQRWALPHRDPRRLLRQLETALAQQPPPAPIAAAALMFTPAQPRRAQAGLFGDAAQEQEKLDRLTARLRELLGEAEGRARGLALLDRCGSPRLQDLHRNDRFTLVSYAPEAQPAAAARPAGQVRCLRALRPPPRIQVELPRLPLAGEPLSLQAALCRLPRKPPARVRRAWGPWRASGQWWTDGAWSRDEWDIELEGAPPRRLARLLYDRRARAWFLLGDYD